MEQNTSVSEICIERAGRSQNISIKHIVMKKKSLTASDFRGNKLVNNNEQDSDECDNEIFCILNHKECDLFVEVDYNEGL